MHEGTTPALPRSFSNRRSGAALVAGRRLAHRLILGDALLETYAAPV
jgi:hypothetical protein